MKGIELKWRSFAGGYEYPSQAAPKVNVEVIKIRDREVILNVEEVFDIDVLEPIKLLMNELCL